MKTHWRSLAMAGVLAVGGLGIGLGQTEARAQAYGFSYAAPGVGVAVGGGGVGVYGGAYPMIAPVAPVVVAPAPVIVPRPVFVPRPVYGGYYHGGYRPYGPPRHYYRR